MKQEAIFFGGKRKNPYICGVLLLLMIYALIWKRVEKDWRKLLCEFANRGLGVNFDPVFSFFPIFFPSLHYDGYT